MFVGGPAAPSDLDPATCESRSRHLSDQLESEAAAASLPGCDFFFFFASVDLGSGKHWRPGCRLLVSANHCERAGAAVIALCVK